jgi:hypothetical protein
MAIEAEILTESDLQAGIRAMSFVRLGSTMINVESIAYTVYHDAVQPLQSIPDRLGFYEQPSSVPQKLVVHFTGGISTAFSGEDADHALRLIGGAMGMGEN